jgi:hypothetical protein
MQKRLESAIVEQINMQVNGESPTVLYLNLQLGISRILIEENLKGTGCPDQVGA